MKRKKEEREKKLDGRWVFNKEKRRKKAKKVQRILERKMGGGRKFFENKGSQRVMRTDKERPFGRNLQRRFFLEGK